MSDCEMISYEQVKNEIHTRILSCIDFSREVPDAEVLDLIDNEVVGGGGGALSLEEKKLLRQELYHAIRKLDVLQELLEDPRITEIMINGADRIFVERGGRVEPYRQRFTSPEKLGDVIQQIVAGCNRVVNEASPIVDARLPDGSRVHVALPPISLDGPAVTIRRFPERPLHMTDLIALGALSREAADFLHQTVRAGYNIFVSGGTGCGKTTFLNALSEFIPGRERIVTIEDNAELQIMHIANLVRLEARSANVEGCREITIRDLIKASLRMRPDRIIVGEVRGAEAIDMLQAMNTGHDGSMSTGHGNSPRDMMRRLETMVLMGMGLPVEAIRGQIAAGIDLLVHLGRLRDGSRKLLEISEVTGLRDDEIVLTPLYRFVETGEDEHGKIEGTWKKEAALCRQEKLAAAGLAPEQSSGKTDVAVRFASE